jgi:DNA-binding HxlR family transcriptional regulator
MGKTVDLHCRAFQAAIEVLSRPWNGLILGLLQDGPLRFSELEERSQGVGPKTLSARLKSLESLGIVSRRIEAGPPVRVQYSLTAKGLAFERVAEAIQHWGGELVAGEAPERKSAEIRKAAGPRGFAAGKRPGTRSARRAG